MEKGQRLNRIAVALLVLSWAMAACKSPPAERSASPVVSSSTATLSDASFTDASVEQDAAAAPELGFVCVPPLASDFERCPKGAAAGDDKLRECLAREAAGPAKKPTFQVAGTASSTFSPVHWRCAEVPLDTKTHVTIDTLAGLDETVPSTCPSHAIDMIGPNQYGAIFFRCSHRARGDDEILEHP